jgi:hypothetical protein
MNTDVCDAMIVYIDEHTSLKLIECASGLYYYDPTVGNKNNDNITLYSFFSTVKANKKYFTHAELEGADKARNLQASLRWPTTEDFKKHI